MKLFRNDYSELAHHRIIEALARYQDEQNMPYGLDYHSLNAEKKILEVFNSPKGKVYFLAGGTQTNVLFISSVLKHYEGAICADTGHINVHETAALEGQGYKIITVPNTDGKISPQDIERVMKLYDNEYMVKPALVYISNSTEIGTIYSKAELLALHKVCKKYNLYFFIDGARLGSALTSKDNDVEPSLLGEVCDAFYVGGTKNGLLLGEALVINNKQLQENYRYHIKNKGAMLAKGYLVGIEFEEAFKDNLYFDLARETNKMADLLKDNFKTKGLDILPSPTNQIFLTIARDKALKLIDRYGCEKWEDLGDKLTIRFVISFSTTEDDVNELNEYLTTL